jgi:hypothetical protein
MYIPTIPSTHAVVLKLSAPIISSLIQACVFLLYRYPAATAIRPVKSGSYISFFFLCIHCSPSSPLFLPESFNCVKIPDTQMEGRHKTGNIQRESLFGPGFLYESRMEN